MPIPIWVDYKSAEQSAAAMARGLSGSSVAWGVLLANAQAILASRTDPSCAEADISYEFEEWQDLMAAARILDLATTKLGVKDMENQKAAAILAACAFGMSGTFVSAAAVIDSHKLLEFDLSPSELVALTFSSPTASRDVFTKLPRLSKHRLCVENLLSFLVTGGQKQFDMTASTLQELAIEEADVWGSYLLRLCRLSLEHLGRLATAKVLHAYESRFPKGYLDRLVSDSPVLLPAQYEAVANNDILASDENLLVTLPTGTGKTLLGELVLLSSLGQASGLVCYIAPYVALGRQVADKISRHTPNSVRIHRLVGGYQEPEPLDPEGQSEVVVATPERFDAILRLRPDLLSKIKCIVFDEAHMIGNGQRGIRLEGMITRLRLAAARGEEVPRFVLLSAVLSNIDALVKWMGIPSHNVVYGTWRPSAKRLLRWTEDGTLRMHAGDDPLRKLPSEVLGETQLPWPNKRFYSTSNFGAVRKQEPQALENVAFLADLEHNQYQQPVLCVCSTRSRTRGLAAWVTQRFSPLEPLPQAIKSIGDLIDQKYPYLRPLKDALQRGVAYHNSSLPHDVREGIEKAVEDRALKVVAATTTLAEGVDLPFRVTILSDWLVFDTDKNRPIDSLLFKNIAGRCGRAGQFTEGDTIIFDNPIGDPHLTSPARRPQLQQQVFFSDSQPVLTSAITKLNNQSSIPALGSQLLAAISENPTESDLASSFNAFSFAYQTDGADIATKRIDEAFQEILDGSGRQPLAVIASPVKLTKLGEAANSGGLSPSTARRLLTAISELSIRDYSRADLPAIGEALLKSLADVPEQTNSDLRRMHKPRSRPIVRSDELRLVLDRWLSGEPIQDIFALLPSNKRSRRSPGLQVWLEGFSGDSTWTEQFAKFSDFLSNCVEFFLPWILRGAEPLSEINGHSNLPWGQWARFAEFGVDNDLAASFVAENVVNDRSVAREIGRQIEALVPDGDPTVDQIRHVLSETVEDDHQTARQVLSWFNQREASL